jgi:hypothetical protein
MSEPSPRFKDLVKDFKDSKYPGWWIPSAEGGWTTPSEKDWGHPPLPIPSKGTEQLKAK